MPILPETEIEPAGHGYKQAHATCHLSRARVKAGHTENSHATQGVTEGLRPHVKQAAPQPRTHSFTSPTVQCTRHKWQALHQILTLPRCGAGNALD